MNSNRESRSIRECLAGAGASPLGALVAEIGRLRQLGDALHAALEIPLRDHLQVATHARGRLLLTADSAAWCTRARYAADQLAAVLRGHGFDVREVRIVTRPPDSPPAPRSRQATRISAATATLLRAVATQTTDETLRSSLLRLAARADP